MCASTSVVFALGYRHCTLTVRLPQAFTCFIDLHEIFECAHLKFTVSGQSKQAHKHTHTRAQCCHASVGLAQAHPNDLSCSSLPLLPLFSLPPSLSFPSFPPLSLPSFTFPFSFLSLPHAFFLPSSLNCSPPSTSPHFYR